MTISVRMKEEGAWDMRTVELIRKKRDGMALTGPEIEALIQGYTRGDVPDYQMAALCMAIYYRGMTEREIADLTAAMVRSGETADLGAIHGAKVDKHSTGGVGDKTSLIVVPLVASAGVPVAKMSGRGLGHTGGTVDKLESIPGFRIELTREEFIRNVNAHKMALVGQSGNLAPADKKIYALRDVTATVESIPLIASSIMSKKIASGADAIVLDVKVGSGAFMKSLDDARALARTMVEIGRRLNRTTVAVLTDMNEPLGFEVGNANEVREAIDVLNGRGEARLTELCLTLAAHMAVLGGAFADDEEARAQLAAHLADGRALAAFRTFVQAQGGDPAVVDQPDRLPAAAHHVEVKAEADGYVTAIDAEGIGTAAMRLGAGRRTKEEAIDHAAGITLRKKVGDAVRRGETLCVLHTNRPEAADDAAALVAAAYRIGAAAPEPQPIVYEILT
jgi:pyrimidine-nucleoside phosphorylase